MTIEDLKQDVKGFLLEKGLGGRDLEEATDKLMDDIEEDYSNDDWDEVLEDDLISYYDIAQIYDASAT